MDLAALEKRINRLEAIEAFCRRNGLRAEEALARKSIEVLR